MARRRVARRNAPSVERFDFDVHFHRVHFAARVGVKIGKPVFAVEYEHLGTKPATWRHDFESKDTELWFLDDGSILIRSASGRSLWDTFTVNDDE
jgi:hypothetical protein